MMSQSSSSEAAAVAAADRRSHTYRVNQDLARLLEQDVPHFEIHPNHKLKKLADENYAKIGKRGTCPPAVKYVLPGASAFEEHLPARYFETELCVIKADTISAVLNCNRLGLTPVCAHNFANAYHPGGGYLKGSSAQEEDLCRHILDLFPSINHSSSLYPIRPNEALLSKGVEVTREPGTLKYVGRTGGKCDIITNALPDNRKSGTPNPNDAKWRQRVTTSIRVFFYTAKQSGCPHVISGAFGCGAFKNPPDAVAEIFAQVLAEEQFRGVFKTVIFAIVDTKGRGNLLPFQRQLKLLDPRHIDGVERELPFADEEPLSKRARSLPFHRPAQPEDAPASAPAPRGDAFIVNHGSFNPPHLGHVMMFEAAKLRLEQEGYRVTEGVMGLASGKHIRKKGASALADDVRQHCISVITSGCGADWIRGDAKGVNYGSGGNMIKGLLKAKASGTTGFNLIGGDVAAKWPPSDRTVIVERGGSRAPRENSGARVYVTKLDAEFNSFSSTEARKARVEGNQTKLQELVGQPLADVLNGLPSSSFKR